MLDLSKSLQSLHLYLRGRQFTVSRAYSTRTLMTQSCLAPACRGLSHNPHQQLINRNWENYTILYLSQHSPSTAPLPHTTQMKFMGFWKRREKKFAAKQSMSLYSTGASSIRGRLGDGLPSGWLHIHFTGERINESLNYRTSNTRTGTGKHVRVNIQSGTEYFHIALSGRCI
jgi:hypothetical protein